MTAGRHESFINLSQAVLFDSNLPHPELPEPLPKRFGRYCASLDISLSSLQRLAVHSVAGKPKVAKDRWGNVDERDRTHMISRGDLRAPYEEEGTFLVPAQSSVLAEAGGRFKAEWIRCRITGTLNAEIVHSGFVFQGYGQS